MATTTAPKPIHFIPNSADDPRCLNCKIKRCFQCEHIPVYYAEPPRSDQETSRSNEYQTPRQTQQQREVYRPVPQQATYQQNPSSNNRYNYNTNYNSNNKTQKPNNKINTNNASNTKEKKKGCCSCF